MEKVIVKQVSQKTIIKNYGVPMGSGGKIDGAINLGDGEGVFSSVQNKIIQLKSLKKQSDKLIIVSSMNDISFDVDDSKLIVNKSQVQGLDEDIDNINTSITSINNGINNINNTLTNLNNTVTQNTTDINTINSKINNINGKIDVLETDISNNTNEIIDIKDDLDDINSQVETNTTNITSIQSTLSQHTTDINTINTSITNINNNLNNLNNEIDTINNSLTTQQTSINDIMDTLQLIYTDITNITDRLNNLSLSSLTDVVLDNVQNNQVLTYDSTTQKFTNKDSQGGSGGATNLSDLNDVNLTDVKDRQSLLFNPFDLEWFNAYPLGDVLLNPGNLGMGKILRYYEPLVPIPPFDVPGWQIVDPQFITQAQLDETLENKLSKFRNKYSLTINPLNVTSNSSGAQYLTYTRTTGVTSGSISYPALSYITNPSDINYINNVNNGKSRVRFSTSTAVNSFASILLNVRNLNRGFSTNAENGFTIRYRIRINANQVSTMKFFAGCCYTQFTAYNLTTGSLAEPFDLNTNVTSFGFGCKSTDTEYKIGTYYNSSSSQLNNPISSSSNMTEFDYLKNKDNDTDFLIEITTPSSSPGTTIWIRVTNTSNLNSALFSILPTYLGGAIMPASGYFLYPMIWIGNGATAQAVSFEVFDIDVYQNN